MTIPESHYDLVVVGATPGGIACALRGARAGLRVLLTNYHGHVGGLWSSGLGATDTQYAGQRAPLYGEFCDRLLAYYRDRYGRDSDQYRAVITKSHSCYSATGPTSEADTHGDGGAPADLPDHYYGKFNFEPHAAEHVLNAMLAGEPGVTVRLNCVPLAVERKDRLIRAVTFGPIDGQPDLRISAPAFADCTYEGDLFALAGVPDRVGRESRDEFGEPHAGRIFTALHFASPDEVGYPREAVEGRLNLEPYEAISQQIFAGSTGEGDHKIQAYTFRLCLSSDPKNRVMPEKPPDYDRRIYLAMRNRWSLGSAIPNGKLKWNTSNLPGGNWDYPEADWPRRREILQRHRNHALGFLWFLQNDDAVPESLQTKACRYGLARDEFTDNDHVPWEMYVREARRMIGRATFREQDATIAPGLGRAPIHRDSIAITDWGMDSHSVSPEMVPGSRREGKFLLTELTRPGQVPWRCLLPEDLDNLLVPVCLSSTHVGWGAIRLEPTWMHLGESAACAVALAHRAGVAVAQVRVSQLQRNLVEHGIMISFFNEFDMATGEPWVPAIQFLGAKWFFADYQARPAAPLDRCTAEIWAGIAADLLTGQHGHLEKTRWAECYPAPGQDPEVTAPGFRAVVKEALQTRNLNPTLPLFPDEFKPLTRGTACQFFYELLAN